MIFGLKGCYTQILIFFKMIYYTKTIKIQKTAEKWYTSIEKRRVKVRKCFHQIVLPKITTVLVHHCSSLTAFDKNELSEYFRLICFVKSWNQICIFRELINKLILEYDFVQIINSGKKIQSSLIFVLKIILEMLSRAKGRREMKILMLLLYYNESFSFTVQKNIFGTIPYRILRVE